MSQRMLNPKWALVTYEICLIDAEGETMLVYETMCVDDEEAIDKLFAIQDVSYARFEISCSDDVIVQGLRRN